MNIDSQLETKGNILLVDEIPDNLQLLSDLLVKIGYIVRNVNITEPLKIEEVLTRLESQLTIQHQKRLLDQEIIKRWETEEPIYQFTDLLAGVLNSSLDGIAALQAVREPTTGDVEDFRCLVVNPAIAKAFGCRQEDMIGKPVLKKILNHIEPELFNRFVEVVEMGEPLERDFYYSSGESCWYHFVAVKLNDGFTVIVRDITARKQMELALQDANQKLEQLANLDGLTNVANRRCFDSRLQREWQRLTREKQPLSLILFDIDAFKAYNDYYGHLAGDDCLIKVVQAVQEVVRRPADLVARYGGEEFTVLLPNTDLEGAIKVAESIQQAINDLAIPHVNSNIKAIVTISLGIASFIPTLLVQPDILIAYADRGLYDAKKQGRDRYCINA